MDGDCQQTHELWSPLINCIDYHHGRWYEFTVDAKEWEQCGLARVTVLLDELAPGEDHARIIKLFKYRDRDARARQKE
jgi:hypothetical protein